MVAKESQAMRIGVLDINHQIKLIMLPRLLVKRSVIRSTYWNNFGGILCKETILLLSLHSTIVYIVAWPKNCFRKSVL